MGARGGVACKARHAEGEWNELTGSVARIFSFFEGVLLDCTPAEDIDNTANVAREEDQSLEL